MATGSLRSLSRHRGTCHQLGNGELRRPKALDASLSSICYRESMQSRFECVLKNMFDVLFYPLVNIQKTMENHHF